MAGWNGRRIKEYVRADGLVVSVQVRAGARAQYLEPPQVPVPPAWSRDTNPRTVYPGEAFERAFAYVLDHDIEGMLLVHGVSSVATDADEVLDHAWVALPGGIVFDGVAQRFFAEEVFHTVMQATAVAVYTPDAGVDRVLRTNSYGPWHTTCRDAAERPFHPVVLAHAS